jgi:hypothetical protein
MILHNVPIEQKARDANKGFVNEMQPSLSQLQSPNLMQPSDRTLDHPTRFTQIAAVVSESLNKHLC